MKRSTQRSIYLQLLLVSVNAVTMFTDKTMKFMLFAEYVIEVQAQHQQISRMEVL